MNEAIFKHELKLADHVSGMDPAPPVPHTLKGLLRLRAYINSKVSMPRPILKDLKAYADMIKGMQS